MTERLHLAPKHRAVIEALLREHLPGVEVWAYGSRVDGRSHDGSDLDLVLRGPGLQEIPVGQVADFEEAMRDSAIPFLVEARDWAWLPERFHREIERGYVVLVEGGSGQPERRQSAGSEGWRETVLGDLIEITHGFAFKGHFISDEPQENILLTPGNFAIGGGFKADKFKYYSGTVPDDFILSKGDLVVSMTDLSKQSDALGYPAFVPECREGKRYLHNQRLGKVLLKNTDVDARYIYYVMCGNAYRHEVLASATGTTVKHTSPGRIKQFRFRLPPLPEQRAIAHILGTLDDKIELNRRMNETLEAMARALFKSWFVDFDPVRAKAALRNHAAQQAPGSITPPLRGGRGDKSAALSLSKGRSPQASRWGESGAAPPPRPWPDIRRQYTSKALHHAQALRQNQTSAEGLLWHYLRNKQLGGYKFRRQQPIGPYVADFACLPEKLLIELDGGQHADPNAPDEQRDQFLRQQGYRVLRFWNNAVFADCFSVLESIYAALTYHPPLEGGSKDASLSGRGNPPPLQPTLDGLASTTPPQGGSDWSVDRARAYLDAMDPEIAALFPDRFVDSELGEIPAGWEVKPLGETFDLTMGQSPPGTTYNEQGEGLPFFQGRADFGFRYPENRKFCTAPIRIAQPDDTLISIRAPVGEINMARERCCVGRGVAALRHKSGSSTYTYYAIEALQPEIQRYEHTGTVFGAITKGQFMALQIVEPPLMLVDWFRRRATTLDERIGTTAAEIHALTILRDTLLPKLISGQLKVRVNTALNRPEE